MRGGRGWGGRGNAHGKESVRDEEQQEEEEDDVWEVVVVVVGEGEDRGRRGADCFRQRRAGCC